MTEFMTHVDIPEAPFRIGYQSNFFFMGSCFADAIGKRMKELKFSVCHNPFGVVYNPLSMAANLELLINKENFRDEDLSFYNELWFSFSHYTLFSDIDKKKCLEKINKCFSDAREFIRKSDVLVITLGTSWVYEQKETGKVVANCHKIPASQFNRFFASSEVSARRLKEAIQSIKRVNSSLKVIFTVSPVRHWKDGAIDNQRSKAALILAIAQIQQELEGIFYFPAYEIFMDELRDYRFYASDMLHPSEAAINYTWKKFVTNLLTEETYPIINDVERIRDSIKHRPRHTNTKSFQKFNQALIQKIEDLCSLHQFMDFNLELIELRKNV